MAAVVGRRESDQSRTRVGIEMRSALAHQVGDPECSLGTGGRGAGFVGENVVWIASDVCVHSGQESETIPEPAQRESSSLGHTHHVPASGEGVAESM